MVAALLMLALQSSPQAKPAQYYWALPFCNRATDPTQPCRQRGQDSASPALPQTTVPYGYHVELQSVPKYCMDRFNHPYVCSYKAEKVLVRDQD